jgi:hypothetical protein
MRWMVAIEGHKMNGVFFGDKITHLLKMYQGFIFFTLKVGKPRAFCIF